MEARDYIRKLARTGSLGHAWLLLGAASREREALAAFLAQALLCGGEADRPCGRCPHCVKLQKGIHPDLIRVSRLPDKREMTVEQIRALRREAYMLPNEAARKVYLLPDGDSMNASAQNALLKILEEPPSYAAFLLLGANPGAFLATVRSRCVTLRALPPAAGTDAGGSPQAEALAEAFIRGDRLAFATQSFRVEKLDREKFDALLEGLYAAAALRAKGAAGPQRSAAILLADLTQKLQQLRRVYVSAGHCLGYLQSFLPGE